MNFFSKKFLDALYVVFFLSKSFTKETPRELKNARETDVLIDSTQALKLLEILPKTTCP